MKKLLTSIVCSLFYFTNFNLCAGSNFELSLKDLCEKSDDIFIAHVVSMESYLSKEQNRIFTDIKMEIVESIKGTLFESEQIKMTVLGGQIGDITTFVVDAPIFKIGAKYLLFTITVSLPDMKNNYIVNGLSQGKFDIFSESGSQYIKRDQIDLPLKLQDKSSIALTADNPISLQDFLDIVRTFLY